MPIDPRTGLLDELRRLQAETLKEGGPFVRYRFNQQTRWREIVKHAKIPRVTVHDLRQTGIMRALLAGVTPITVQKIAGHSDISTTTTYYAEASKDDLRKGVAKVWEAAG